MRTHQSGWIQEAGTRRKKWVGRYRVYKPDGKLSFPKKFLGYKSEMSKSQAALKLQKFLRAGGDKSVSALNFSDYWNDTYVPRHRVAWSAPSAKGYAAYFNAYLRPEFGAVRMADIDEQQISNWFEKLRQKYSRSVVTKCRIILKSVLTDAVDDDVLMKSPLRKVRIPKTKEPNRPTLEASLASKVLAEVSSSAKHSALLHIAVFCAIRPAEVFGLHWRSFLNDVLLIRDTAWGGKVYADTTKTGERRIAVPPATRAAILRWQSECPDKAPGALMFPNGAKKPKPISSHNFRNRVLVPLREKLKLDVPLTFQVLRRSHATRNQRRLKDEQSHLGHRSVKTTADIYVQEIPASVRRMVAADERKVLGFGAKKKSTAALTAAQVVKPKSLKHA